MEILWKFLTARHFVYFRTYLVAGHLETAYSETRENDSYRKNVLLSILKSDVRVFSNIFYLTFFYKEKLNIPFMSEKCLNPFE